MTKSKIKHLCYCWQFNVDDGENEETNENKRILLIIYDLASNVS